MQVVKLTAEGMQGRTIIVNDDGTPVLVHMHLRQATTSPTRIKALLCTGGLAMPFAVPVLKTDDGAEPTGYTPEFRLEMN